MIRFSGVWRFYGSHPALQDVSFTLPDKGIVCVLGLNGAGKSTLLKIIAGYHFPHQGNVEICEYSAVDDPVDIRCITGYMPERTPLYDVMTVSRYLAFIAGSRGISCRDVPLAVAEVLASTGLTDVADRNIASLSHGFRQRISIAQALVHKPKVLVLDEPANGLDPRQILELRLLLQEFSKKTLVILSTHIMQEAEALADYCVILHAGRCVASGTVQELLAAIATNTSATTLTIESAFLHFTEGEHEIAGNTI